MQAEANHDFDWIVRTFVYTWVAEHEQLPDVAQTAAGLGVTVEEVRTAYEWLNEHHALLLEAGTHDIRIANPFSGIPTAFRVHTIGHSYWANCAWDAFGILAALHSDGHIETSCADNGTPVNITVEKGQVNGHGEVIHFPLPFSRWYEDLIFT